ncbi:cytochrome c-type biogenesis protein CcmH [Pseudomonas sp. Choline-3u-10]|jgi:cytochrome c-type biogenesis protein CcmH|uniref:cytochrome c-type biogenesis protein n=1 Tax=Pseudomonadaceae TaxID=135621 RepID=UPI000617AB28|nr:MULTISPECIES: cytochrome c-type biogenesis protein [Pseudomonadaceae]MAL36819.1 cytochrome c-type biogenesis protein CcmH [Pseudomonas sp.]MBU0951062.1 cytochrome c-type biogenesis protein CcmH [Gammaproteobacteria bacterium]KJJ63870.1 cytochrome C [Pseudomonas sp. 10B238]MBK3795002.1 cytochrome c-type biogenesis protein CcmH [Stutzerimonas stutzeri]MBK3878645.1 cytochrome c-type biogenesis protein CcmH [Stutzerimonas stutzeri]|tara:strand:- start:33 stop:506 length:474 start_codon:yes stop_codon:yes gene_type:complete
MKQLIQGLLLTLCLLGSASAAIDAYEFKNEAERERYRTLVEELRCPKCQNQNIADSNAPIAMDLRREIYRMLEEGQSNEQIVDYLVARYGDFVLYKPPVNAKTLVLWYGPIVLLVIGFAVLAFILIRRRRASDKPASNTLTEAERERLATLLDRKEP